MKSPSKVQNYVNKFKELFPLSSRTRWDGGFASFEYDTVSQIEEFSTRFASALGIHAHIENMVQNGVGHAYIVFREVEMNIVNLREKIQSDKIVEDPLGSIQSHDYFNDMTNPSKVWIATTPINIRVVWSGPEPTRWCIQTKHPPLKRLVRRAFELKGCKWEETETASYVRLPDLKKDETPLLFIINNFPFFVVRHEEELYDGSYNPYMRKDPDAPHGFHVKPGIHPSRIGNRRSARIGRAPKRWKDQ